MAIAKVILNGETLMDTTQKTVTANTMLDGTTALKNDGTGITGNIASKSSSDLTASGATVTVPAGYYAEAASKSVATTTHPNPTASVNSATGLVTASHTQGTGYVTGGTTTGTMQLSTQAAAIITPSTSQQTAVAAGKYTTGAVTVNPIPSQYIIPSGTKEITENGEGIDVSAYASVDVSVPSSAPNLQEKTVTPSDQTQVITADSGGTTTFLDGTVGWNRVLSTGSFSPVYWVSNINYPSPWLRTPVNGETYHLTLDYYRSGYDRHYLYDDDLTWSNGSATFTATAGSRTLSMTISYEPLYTSSTHYGYIKLTSSLSDEDNPGSDTVSVLLTQQAPGYDALSKVTVNPIPSEYTVPTGTIQIDQNGTVDVTQYASAEVNVSGGVTPVTVDESDVNFIDYDGTILYSYTASDFANLSALPANPSHAGLTAQGWNWSLSDAKTYVAQYGKLWIGQMYITSDGKTRIYIHLDNPDFLSPYLTIAVNGTVVVDWGDDTAADTVTGTSNTTLKYTLHEYATTGDYVITIAVSNGSFVFYGSNNHSSILRTVGAANNRARSRAYSTAITKIEIGSSVSIGAYGFFNVAECKTITIPSGVTSIGNLAFYNCHALQSVTIPSGVTSIGNSVFYYCYALQFVTIPSGVTSIGSGMFSYCYSLQSVTIPSGIMSIGNAMFSYCYSLQSVTIPSDVTSIESSMFNNCQSLQSVIIPSGVTSIGASTFGSCYSLQSVTIPSGVTSIETSIFSSCYALQSVTIPSDVTRIGSNAFASCWSLQSIIIPSNVTSIEGNAFSGCYGMLEYHFLPATPPTAGTYMFSSIQSGTKIYVPYSADHSILEAYQTATNWSTYASYMEEEPQ